ncbi:hypothetical protein PG997_013166 [Apiospora hydei]|uniref:Uncharacterized protein n=1 Tax=Apiospora hydei TaxID=1337664 RepID=A0ABR1V5E5_9PEZI
MTMQRPDDNPLLVAATSLGLLPPPGFSSIAIPLPTPSLYLSPFTTAPVNPFGQPDVDEDEGYSPPILFPPSRASSSSRSSWARRQPAPPGRQGRLHSALCRRQSRKPKDSTMPVMNGFDAAREIRAFEEESMHHCKHDTSVSSQISPGSDANLAARDNADKGCPHKRPTRRAILVGASASGAAALSSRYTDAGFDLVMSKPYHVRMIVDLLFGGPATNIVSLYGGIDEKELLAAGYPLQLRPWSRPSETNVRGCGRRGGEIRRHAGGGMLTLIFQDPCISTIFVLIRLVARAAGRGKEGVFDHSAGVLWNG